MINTICHTNIDNYQHEKWPSQMSNPQIGHLVESSSGKQLKIVQITHCERTINNRSSMGGSTYIESYLKIELNR